MTKTAESRQASSPVSILTELAVEGTSTFIEAQRIFLNLIQQENDLLNAGVKDRVAFSAPVAALTNFAHRGIDTLVNLQQGLLTTTSKQTMKVLQATQNGNVYQAEHVVDLAREAMENFVHANEQLLRAITQEAINATKAKPAHTVKPEKKTELAQLAREAAALFIDAQKRVLDVLGQQMNVNVNAATQAVEAISSTRLAPVAEIPVKAVKTLFESQSGLLKSVIGAQRRAEPEKSTKARTARRAKTS